MAKPRTRAGQRLCLAGLLCWLGIAITARAEVVQYTYDTAGRLTSADYGNGRTIYYTYDPAGSILSRKIVVITDTDGDGMDDQWEQDNFLTLARDGTDDLDLDGLTDAEEYFAGTDPDNAASTLKVLRVERTTELPVNASLSLNNGVATVLWNSLPGETYKVQYKDSLSETNWTDLAPAFVTTATVSAEMDVTPGPQRFYRVVQLGVTAGSYATVSWTAVPDKTYRVQFKNALGDPFWTDLAGDVTAVTAIASRADVAPQSPSRFYRVMVLP